MLFQRPVLRTTTASTLAVLRASRCRCQARRALHESPAAAAIVGEQNLEESPMFTVTTQNGFLPRKDPLNRLPDSFSKLESLLERMPIKNPETGRPGLLASGEFGEAVLTELPLYDVDGVHDPALLSALFRDYTFAASAYLLEPCDLRYRATKKDYGIGRLVLPRSIAVPLTKVAQKINSKPFMEYALSYALYNYKRIDPAGGLTYDNLKLIRSFTGMESEKGFILNHVTMVAHSPKLVRHALGVLNTLEAENRSGFDHHMANLNATYQKVNDEMEFMWARSNPADYLDFRTFIMGTKNQPMFPDGVVYEGINNNKPVSHRGESGANDSMVPLADNLLQIKMPDNPLTEILRDFRTYRPTDHKTFLELVQIRANQNNLRQFALGDPNSAALYLANVDQIRAFRHRHWSFTKEYIIKYTEHPVATGGSPIVTWLPNQLMTVLDVIEEVASGIDRSLLTKEHAALVEEIEQRADAQKRVLLRDVQKLKERFPEEAVAPRFQEAVAATA